MLDAGMNALEGLRTRDAISFITCRVHPTRVVHRGIAEHFLNQTSSTLFGIPSH